MPIELLTQREAASLLRVSERQISRYRATGALPYQKVDSKGIRIRREHVEAMLKPGTPTAAAAPVKSWIPTRWTNDAAELPAAITRAPSRKAEFAE
jgi:excisionase family DNA binding protein